MHSFSDLKNRVSNHLNRPDNAGQCHIGELCYMGAGTYPRATWLQDGSILGTHTCSQNGENVIATTRSTDSGVTWSPLGEVTRGVGDIDNPFVVQLPNGRILCAFRNHSKDANGGYTHYRITVCHSEDGGRGWKYLSTPDENGNPATGLWEPFMRIAKDGSLQLYYSREIHGNDQDSILRISSDGGATWSPDKTISGAGLECRDGMLGVAPFNDGEDKLITVFETNQDGPMSIKSITSSDDGMNWGNRQSIYHSSNGKVAAAPQVANCGGILVVTFMTDEDGELAIKMLVQTGPGPSWDKKMLVGPGKSTWAGVMTLDDCNVLVMFDNGDCKTRKITLR